MLLTDLHIHEADTLEQASALLAQYGPDARVLAGGTDLLVDLKTSRFETSHLVSINRIRALRGIRTADVGLRIGGLTTPNELGAALVIQQRFPAILDATREMAAPQIRSMGTVGGNIAGAVPSADLPPILIVLGASVVLWSHSGSREIRLEDFFTGPRSTLRRDDEILTEIALPFSAPVSGAAYARFALREANACAVAGVAASLRLNNDRTVREARICLGAVAPKPLLAKSAGAALVGQTVHQQAIRSAAAAAMEEAKPITDIRGAAQFRRELIGILTQRAIISAHQRVR